MRYDEALEVRTREARDVARDAARVGVVERGVHLVQDEERRRMEAGTMDVSELVFT